MVTRKYYTQGGEIVMKINPYIQVQQLYNTKKVSQTKKTAAVGRTDGVEI